MNRQGHDSPKVPPTSHGDADAIRSIRSENLFANFREVLIEHAGQTYRLRRTRNGKLILQK